MSRSNAMGKHEVRNSRITKLSTETELRQITSHFELFKEIFFRVTNSILQNIKLNFELPA